MATNANQCHRIATNVMQWQPMSKNMENIMEWHPVSENIRKCIEIWTNASIAEMHQLQVVPQAVHNYNYRKYQRTNKVLMQRHLIWKNGQRHQCNAVTTFVRQCECEKYNKIVLALLPG